MCSRFDVCMLISVWHSWGADQVSKDIMDLGGYLGTYPITRKGGYLVLRTIRASSALTDTCKMVFDGVERFIPAGVYTYSLLTFFRAAHDRATKRNQYRHT